MKSPSKTTGPLHFEDLEPHRFEDLVRQLIYDFRTWKSLEGLGRSGSDEGFDVRGVQIIESLDSDDQDKEDEDNQEASSGSERLWLIQCKRQHSIPPKNLPNSPPPTPRPAPSPPIFPPPPHSPPPPPPPPLPPPLPPPPPHP